MKNNNEGIEIDETIEENLEVIESSALRLTAFIEGLEAGAVLQGLDKDDVYKVGKLGATASNIRCYCGKIREILQKLKH